MKKFLTITLFSFITIPQFATAQTNLIGHAAALYKQAQGGKWFAAAEKLKPEILPTSDGKSFFTVWRAAGGANTPKCWIVSLPGTHGFATDDLANWSPHLKGRDIGLVSVQWWLGEGDGTESYYRPEQIYREVDLILRKLGVRPGTVMLHGFSRGSANTYAIAALDSGRGKKYFTLNVASSGGVGLDYPPTRMILSGGFGPRPLQGTRWITVAGGRDPNPDRDGIPGMKRTATWLQEQGATVVVGIEDAESGHGALMLNPKNTSRVLDLFLNEKKQAIAASR